MHQGGRWLEHHLWGWHSKAEGHTQRVPLTFWLACSSSRLLTRCGLSVLLYMLLGLLWLLLPDYTAVDVVDAVVHLCLRQLSRVV